MSEVRWPEDRATYAWSVRKGETFISRLRWGIAPYQFSAITAISQPIPLRMTVPLHGLPDRWPVIVMGHPSIPSSRVRVAVVVDANTIELYTKAPPDSTQPYLIMDGSDFGAYTSGAFLVSPTPMNMSGYSARMHIKASKGDAAPLLALASGGQGITVDDADKFIEITITAAQSEAMAGRRAVADLEMVSGDVVSRIADIKFRFLDESTITP